MNFWSPITLEIKLSWVGSNDKLLNVSKTIGLVLLSSPLLTTKVKVPADSLRAAICHLTLSTEPESNDPDVTGPLLFQISPLLIASKVKASFKLELSLTDAEAYCQAVAEPDTTLVTNKVLPPLEK